LYGLHTSRACSETYSMKTSHDAQWVFCWELDIEEE
jgi:hypothetical protein